MSGMNPGFAKYLAAKKAGTLPPKPMTPGMGSMSHPLLQKKISVATHVPKGKPHSKVNVKPHKNK